MSIENQKRVEEILEKLEQAESPKDSETKRVLTTLEDTDVSNKDALAGLAKLHSGSDGAGEKFMGGTEQRHKIIDQRSHLIDYDPFNTIHYILGENKDEVKGLKMIDNKAFNYHGVDKNPERGDRIRDLMTIHIPPDELYKKQDNPLDFILQDQDVTPEAKIYMLMYHLAGGKLEMERIEKRLKLNEGVSNEMYNQEFRDYKRQAEEILKNYIDKNLDSESELADSKENKDINDLSEDEEVKSPVDENEDEANELLLTKIIEAEGSIEVKEQKEKVKNEIKELMLGTLAEEFLSKLALILEDFREQGSLNDLMKKIFSEECFGNAKINSPTLKSLSRLVNDSELTQVKSIKLMALIEGAFKEILSEDDSNISGEEGNNTLSEKNFILMKNIEKSLRRRLEKEKTDQSKS